MKPTFEPGLRVGKYTVVARLGRGGMGGVWEVMDDAGQGYAIKSPAGGIDAEVEAAKRFVREANALHMLDHPNLVAAVEVFVERGFLYLVMELVHGHTLTHVIADGPFEARRALAIVRQVLEGVGHAHKHGIVHRDLKPDNIMLVDMGGREWAKIVDFGLVKLIGDAKHAMGDTVLTTVGLVFGTPAYMSPEQAQGDQLDGRTDLYAVATILFEMLTGRVPFEDPDPRTQLRMQVKAQPPRLDMVVKRQAWCTPQLIALIEGGLIKDPEHRFASAEIMIAALDDAVASIDKLG